MIEEISAVEEERNFYYEKLREIEQRCHQDLNADRDSQAAEYVVELLKSAPADFLSEDELTK